MSALKLVRSSRGGAAVGCKIVSGTLSPPWQPTVKSRRPASECDELMSFVDPKSVSENVVGRNAGYASQWL